MTAELRAPVSNDLEAPNGLCAVIKFVDRRLRNAAVIGTSLRGAVAKADHSSLLQPVEKRDGKHAEPKI